MNLNSVPIGHMHCNAHIPIKIYIIVTYINI